MTREAATRDVIVIGAGQAGLAAAYYLRRAAAERPGLDFLLLDAAEAPGGAWRHGWDSLRLFSPAAYSSLPGWQMPDAAGHPGSYPNRDAVIDYLARYEARYGFPIERPVTVRSVRRDGEALLVEGDRGAWRARAVLSATGTWGQPWIPPYPGRARFRGRQLHSADYREPGALAGARVLVVGGGNSGAQILAEVSEVAEAGWVTLQTPSFLPDDVDGRVLFERATARLLGRGAEQPAGGLGDIVMVPPVRAARARGVLHSRRPFLRFTETGVVWPDGSSEAVDAVIWCTGFRPALDHLRPLDVVEPDGRVAVAGNRAVKEPRLWLHGYGDWTGAASATLMGAGRVAREMIPRLVASLSERG